MASTQDVMKEMFRLVGQAPSRIAPERAKALWEEVSGGEGWDLYGSETEANFYAVVEERKVFASYAGLASVWCLSYCAFRVVDLSSYLARSEDLKGKSLDIGFAFSELNLQEYLDYAQRLFRADEAWPKNLFKPKHDAERQSTEEKVNNVFLGAVSWILLHEIAHIHLGHEKFFPASNMVGQEHEADAFATEWILDNAENEQREFRVLVVLVAQCWLFLNELTKGQGRLHPPAILRFREAVARLNVDDQSLGLEFATYVLKTIFDPETEMPTFDTCKSAFDWMCERLEKLFSNKN